MSTSTSAKIFGYARVSTAAQTNDRQTDALEAQGIDPADIFTDKISGARESRPGLDDLLSRVRPGDTITVVSLDRLGRSALHILQTFDDLTSRGIKVRSLKEGESTEGATGELLRGIMVLIAQWERKTNAERVAEARAAKAARAKEGEQVAGRPRTATTPAMVAKIKGLKSKGLKVSEIQDATGASRASIYRALADTK